MYRRGSRGDSFFLYPPMSHVFSILQKRRSSVYSKLFCGCSPVQATRLSLQEVLSGMNYFGDYVVKSISVFLVSSLLLNTSRIYSSRTGRLGNPQGRRLDYGCGAADFVLTAFDGGWVSVGVHPYLQRTMLSPLLEGRLCKFDIAGADYQPKLGKFDCISL
jgi:hypothetical protein